MRERKHALVVQPSGRSRLAHCLRMQARVLFCLALAPILFFGSLNAQGDDAGVIFLPSDFKVSGNDVQTFVPYSSLSNDELIIRAEQLRDASVDANQRAMNYRWLSENAGASKTIVGGRAVSKLVERQLKAYIESRKSGQWLKEKLMPESRDFIKDVDYDLKLRSDRLVIGLTYEF